MFHKEKGELTLHFDGTAEAAATAAALAQGEPLRPAALHLACLEEDP